MAALHDAIVPFSDGDDIGVGIDSASGDRKGLVVNQVVGAPKDAAGSTSEFSIIRISSTSDLESSLSVDADASAGIAAFAGGSARFSFAQQTKIQTSSLFMAVTARVQLASESIDAPALTAAAAAVIDNPQVFADRYGDMFVRSFQRGGFFVGVLQIDTASSSEAEQIAASLQGAYGLFSADANTKLQNVASQYKSQLFVSQYSEGGTILQIGDQNDPTQLVQSVSTFLKSFRDNPNAVAVPFNCLLSPVTIAAGPLPLDAAQRQNARDVIVECARRRSATMDMLNLVQFISDHNSQYDFSNCSMDVISKKIAGFQSDLDLIAKCASSAIDDPANAALPSDYAAKHPPVVPYPTTLPTSLPVRKPTAPATGPDLYGFLGTWRNTNPQGHITYVTLEPLDAKRLSAKGHLTSLLFSQVKPQLPAGGLDFTGHASLDAEKNLSGGVSIPGFTIPALVTDPRFGFVSLGCTYIASTVEGDPATMKIQYIETEVGGGAPTTPPPVLGGTTDIFKRSS